MNRVLLNNVDHADLRVAIRAGAAFGDDANQLPLYPSEFEEAQRCFPIVFRREHGICQAYALLGLDRDENLFLDGERWTSSYVPAFQRRGPFSIGITPPQPPDIGPGEPMIHVDLDDPRVGATDGLPLFREHGGNAPLLNHVADLLRVIHEGMDSASSIYAAWDDAGVLRPTTMQVYVADEEGYELPDLFTVDREALAALDGEVLGQWHRSGLLALATMAAVSLGNVQRLIELKNAKRAAG